MVLEKERTGKGTEEEKNTAIGLCFVRNEMNLLVERNGMM